MNFKAIFSITRFTHFAAKSITLWLCCITFLATKVHLELEREEVLFSWLTRKYQMNAFYLEYTKKVMFIPLLICACRTQISIRFYMVYHVYAFLICLKCYLSNFRNMHVFEFKDVCAYVYVCLRIRGTRWFATLFIFYISNDIANMSSIMRKW